MSLEIFGRSTIVSTSDTLIGSSSEINKTYYTFMNGNFTNVRKLLFVHLVRKHWKRKNYVINSHEFMIN